MLWQRRSCSRSARPATDEGRGAERMGWKMSHRSSAQLIIMWSGAALIAAGILMIIPQLYFEILLMQKLVHPNTSGAEFEASKGLKVSTSYVGVMTIAENVWLSRHARMLRCICLLMAQIGSARTHQRCPLL